MDTAVIEMLLAIVRIFAIAGEATPFKTCQSRKGSDFALAATFSSGLLRPRLDRVGRAVIGELRDLARTHAPEAVRELARLAMHAKSETARIAAIRELLDRGFGKATQPIVADGEVVPDNLDLESLRAEILSDVARVFPDLELVPKRPALATGTV
jgi:hypothetical protein